MGRAIGVFIVWCVLVIPWVINVYKLTECDFVSDYKCEVIHGVGLFGPASYITVWVNTDNNKIKRVNNK